MNHQIEGKEHFHGSDLEKIEQYFGIPKESITGFGANVNPLGISPKMKQKLSEQIDVVTAYPDPEYTELREHIAAYAGCRQAQVIVGNGCTELISLFIHVLNPQEALIVSPTYSEYEREVRLSKGNVRYYALKESCGFQMELEDFFGAFQKETSLCILCNPNNPTSTALTPEMMEQILSWCRKRNIFVMIDETYAEFAPDHKSISSAGLLEKYDNFVILRGISKFFAAPGLRLGYAMTGSSELLSQVKMRQNPWSLNSLADAAGKLMFTDTAYIEQTRRLISSERERIYQELCTWKNIKVYQPYANFILVRILRDGLTSYDVFLHAIRRGLMLRDCSNFPGLEDGTFFRFCFMLPEKNTELLCCLKELLEMPSKDAVSSHSSKCFL